MELQKFASSPKAGLFQIAGWTVNDAVFGGGRILIHKKGEFLWTFGMNSGEHYA